MNNNLIQHIHLFTSFNVPRYITMEIQKCALHHLKLNDMGKLRDRMEGQQYYDNLKNDILTEYVFESLLYKRPYCWDKRMNKDYKRKIYNINNHRIRLISLRKGNYPKISLDHTDICVMGFAVEDTKVYLSGLANKEIIINNGLNFKNNIYELRSFENLLSFSTREELLELI